MHLLSLCIHSSSSLHPLFPSLSFALCALLRLPQGCLPTQANAALRIDINHLHQYLIPFFQDIRDLLDMALCQLGDMDEAVGSRKKFDNRTKTQNPSQPSRYKEHLPRPPG